MIQHDNFKTYSNIEILPDQIEKINLLGRVGTDTLFHKYLIPEKYKVKYAKMQIIFDEAPPSDVKISYAIKGKTTTHHKGSGGDQSESVTTTYRAGEIDTSDIGFKIGGLMDEEVEEAIHANTASLSRPTNLNPASMPDSFTSVSLDPNYSSSIFRLRISKDIYSKLTSERQNVTKKRWLELWHNHDQTLYFEVRMKFLIEFEVDPYVQLDLNKIDDRTMVLYAPDDQQVKVKFEHKDHSKKTTISVKSGGHKKEMKFDRKTRFDSDEVVLPHTQDAVYIAFDPSNKVSTNKKIDGKLTVRYL